MDDLLHSPVEYRYASLPEYPPHPPHIRLLQIDLHKANDEDHLNCTLETFAFNSEDGQCPTYIGLSYTWGLAEDIDDTFTDELEPFRINVNRKSLQVSINLYDGLREIRRRLRESNGPNQYFWVDAICIDQNNFAEKGLQVDMMGDIFRHATGIIVWLGTGLESEIQEVTVLVKNVASLMQGILSKVGDVDEKSNYVGYWQFMSESERQNELDRHGLPPRGATEWHYFWRFFKRRWFSRIWAIQELVLAQRIEYHCSQFTLPRDEILLCTDFLYWEMRMWPEVTSQTDDFDTITSSRNVFVIDDLYHEHGRLQYHDRVALVGPHSNKDSPWVFLMNLLYSSRRHKATLYKDKVYGLLGLVRTKIGLSPQALEHFIKADYTKTSRETFLEAAKGIILNTQWLGPLILVETRLDLDNLSSPSYVPDLAARGDQFGLGWQVFEDVLPPLEEISSKAPQDSLLAFEEDLLRCQGIRLATLASVSEPFTDLYDSKTDFRHGAAIIDAAMYSSVDQTLKGLPWRAFLVSDKRLDSTTDLGRSFACFCLHRIFRRLSHRTTTSASDIITALINSPLASTLLGRPSVAAFLDEMQHTYPHSHTALLKALHQESLPFETIFSCHYLDRALFRTTQGDLGTCYSAMRPGDQVWFLARSPCPFVLRKVTHGGFGNRFRLVGWAYLEGFPAIGSSYKDWISVEIE